MKLITSSDITVIVGLGVTGLSVARFLHAQKKRFMVMDSRENPPGLDEFKNSFAGVPLVLGRFDEDSLVHASEIILNPGVSLKTPEIVKAIEAGVSVIGDIELFARAVNKPVIAITGSNAKTTVTTLVGQMALDAGLKVSVGGNIGRPALDLLNDDAELYVLELSSFQLETTSSLKPVAATILNVSEDHMDRYDSLREYHQAKQRIYFGAKNIVVNREDMLTQPPLAQGVTCYSFGLNAPDRQGFGLLSQEGQQYLAFEFKPLMQIDQLQLRGLHNVANVLAALALGNAAGIAMDSMLMTLNQFAGLPHRCQLVRTLNGVDYINDSKATNVGATLAALKGFVSGEGKNIVLIAGGDGKGADFAPMAAAIKHAVAQLILIGRDASMIAEAISDDVSKKNAASLQEAVEMAKAFAKPGMTVLLSPACASFDMFRGYEDRGNQFIAAVMQEAA